MFHDLIEFIKSKLGGTNKKVPPSSKETIKENIEPEIIVEKEQEKSQKPTKNKQKEFSEEKSKKKKTKKTPTVTILSLLVSLGILSYWISLMFNYSTSKTLQLRAELIGYTDNPFGIELLYDIQKRPLDSALNIGDKLDISLSGGYCEINHDCIKMTVSEKTDKNIILSIDNDLIPTKISMKDFNALISNSEKNRMSSCFIISGKYANDKFYLEKIEMAPTK